MSYNKFSRDSYKRGRLHGYNQKVGDLDFLKYNSACPTSSFSCLLDSFKGCCSLSVLSDLGTIELDKREKNGADSSYLRGHVQGIVDAYCDFLRDRDLKKKN